VTIQIPAFGTGPVPAQIRIYTLAGRKVITANFNSVQSGQQVTVSLINPMGHALANGLYFVRVNTPFGQTLIKLLVLE
jgi:hypothetical protein